MNVIEYLNRIGIEKAKKPGLAFLEELQMKHLLAIPFEDLDIPDGDKIILDLSRIYKKVISNRRGGFCYELNGLFHWLLTELGFDAEMLSARVYSSERESLGPEFDHMTLLVHLDKNYIVDVGFGDSFRKPIVMPNGECSDVSGNYKIFHSEENRFELRRKENDNWLTQFIFSETPRKFSDFENMCDYQQSDPGSIFRNRMLCTSATSEGRITLTNSSFTITSNGEKKKVELSGSEEFSKLLYQYFGIKLK